MKYLIVNIFLTMFVFIVGVWMYVIHGLFYGAFQFFASGFILGLVVLQIKELNQ